MDLKYPPFCNLNPSEVEFTALFPEYPKSHKDGYATVIELEDDIALRLATDTNFALDLIKTMQYSRSNQSGGGFRKKEHVPFFGKSNSADFKNDTDTDSDSEDDLVPMQYCVRQCAGVKTCEFFKVIPHTEVDLVNGLDWAKGLAEQERSESYSGHGKVLTLYQENKDELCTRPILGATRKCGGKTVIRSKNQDRGLSVHGHLFIGCEYWQPCEKGHIYQSLDGYNPLAVLRIWGRERCHVHEDILEALQFNWDNYDGTIHKFQSNMYRRMPKVFRFCIDFA